MIYWHRELPPFDSDAVGEHTLEADNRRVPSAIAHRGELWDECKPDLMARTSDRLKQDVSRLGGRYAQVLNETIDPKQDEAAGEAWLHGCFESVL
jgi:hypothetical protein